MAPALSAAHPLLPRKPELWAFGILIALFNLPLLMGTLPQAYIFYPAAVSAGEWWRCFTHPFVHVTWYHLLLDGAAFLTLYRGLFEASLWRRLSYVIAAAAGSLLASLAASEAISGSGLCGLSGIAHGLMAVSALEMLTRPGQATERRIGLACLILVVGKAAIEAVTGRMVLEFLSFGMLGSPVAVSHAGGVIGGLLVFLCCRRASG